MISHVYLGTNDFERAMAFYSASLPFLGWEARFVEPEGGWAGWQPEAGGRPLFLIGRPYDGEPASPGNGQMVALLAPSRAAVNAFYDACLANGGMDEGAPGLRPHYHPDYYGAYVRDPDGNKICACCHHPE
jgi:catechol 2,3-dioxygenase-like lactoylglutathione lyase family enzyme